MSVLLTLVFIVMAACALVSALTGALMVLGLAERSFANRLLQRVLFYNAIMWCTIGCIVILAGGS
jgi:hypothetical protein